MKSPQEIFEKLQAEYGEYGEYVLLQQPYIYDSETYKASAVTLQDIADMQEDWYTDDEGYPDAGECGYLTWDIVNKHSDDESDACDWGDYDAFDVLNNYIKSGK